jgi:hypothetical protein
MGKLFLALSLAALITSSGTAQNREESSGAEEFTAVALSPGGPLSNAVAAALEIDVERWSTLEERQRLIAALGKGQRAMLEVLHDLPRLGAVRPRGELGLTLHYAHQTRTEDGGRRIFLATDRPIGFAETWYGSRTVEYPFTFIELNVPPRGEGTGRLSLATKVTASRDGRFVHAENWDTNIELKQVKRR